MMRKNAILGAALAGVLGAVSVGSQAGTVGSLPRVFAYPLFQGTTAVAVAIAPISFSTAAPLSTTNNYYVYVSLTAGGAFDAIYVPATTDLKIVDPAQAPIVGLTVSAVAKSTNSPVNFLVFTVTTTSNPVPVNSTITYTAPAGAVDTQGLATVGATVSAQIDVGGTLSTTTISNNVDPASGAKVVATSAAPTTATVVASDTAAFKTPPVTATANENTKIDVISGGGKALTTSALSPAGTVDFGAVYLSDVSGVFAADGSTPYTISSATVVANSLSFAVTGNFAAFGGSTNKIWLDVAAACPHTTAIAATSVTATTATFTGIANGTSNTPRFICGQVDGTTQISPTQPSVASGAFALKDAASGNTTYVTTASPAILYNLGTNGSIVDTWLYFPAVVSDQKVYIRIINVGSVAATTSVALIDDATGTIGTAHAIGSSIPVNGSALFSQTDIENAIGTVNNPSRPRLRFTAPGQIRVQTFVVSGTSATIGDLNAAQGCSASTIACPTSPASNGN